MYIVPDTQRHLKRHVYTDTCIYAQYIQKTTKSHPQWCVECAIQNNNEALLDSEVDMVMFLKLRDVDLDADPLIAFPCGHAYTISMADGLMGMDDVYERDMRTREYLRAKPVVVSTVCAPCVCMCMFRMCVCVCLECVCVYV